MLLEKHLANMTYTYTIADSVDDLDVAAWKAICDGHDDAIMDPGFLRAVERSSPQGSSVQYLTFFDDQATPVACTVVSQFTMDGALLMGGFLAALVRLIRVVFPKYLNFKVVMCGLPVSLGSSHFQYRESVDRERLMNSLAGRLHAIAKQARAWLIVAKEFNDDERELMSSMESHRYLQAPSLPMNVFERDFANLDEFMQALRSHYRYKINKSRKKFARAEVEVERFTDPEDICRIYTKDLHSLYVLIAENAEHRLEILSREFFHELAQQCSPNVILTVLRQQGTVIAFAWSLASGTSYRNMFVGIDAEANAKSDAYFNLMLEDMDHALQLGATKIYFGQTADSFKSRLGCYPDPRWIYVRIVPRWLHWCMARTARWVFPAAEPTEPRDLFKPAEVAMTTT